MLLEISSVESFPPDPGQFYGFHIDSPEPNAQSNVYALTIAGWVLGREQQPVAVELRSEGSLLGRVKVEMPRPDIADAYPDVSGASTSGFYISVSALTFKPSFEVLIRAVFPGELCIPIGRIRGKRQAINTDFEPSLRPLMITTYGRTGSSLLMLLLGLHPQIVTYGNFVLDARPATYWTQILQVLSEPASYLQSLAPDFSDEYWWLGRNTRPSDLPRAEPDIEVLIGGSSIEALVAFVQGRIEAFYERVANLQGKANPVYFAEKYPLNNLPAFTWSLYPNAREVFLIRDMRDMFSSILAFNRKRGFDSFGRETVNTDTEFLKVLREAASFILLSWRRRLDKGFLLRYEDLVLHPEETLRSLLDYLGLDSRKPTIARMLEESTEVTPELQREHRTTSTARDSIGRWRTELDNRAQEACTQAFGDVLSEFGYTV